MSRKQDSWDDWSPHKTILWTALRAWDVAVSLTAPHLLAPLDKKWRRDCSTWNSMRIVAGIYKKFGRLHIVTYSPHVSVVIFEMLTHLHPLSKLLIIYQVPGISQNESSLYTSTDIYFMFGHALSHASHRPSPSPPWAPAAWQRDSAQHVQRQPMTGRHWQHFTMTWASNDFHFHLFMRSKIHYFYCMCFKAVFEHS